MFPFASVLVFLMLIASQASAGEIFKCVAKDGGPLYQNFPCNIDSMGWLPWDPLVAKTPSMPGVSAADKSTAGSSKAEPKNMASMVKPTYSELRTGMSADEVRALLGEPQEMDGDEPAEGGRISIWRYADGRIVQFDHKHYVTEIQQR